TAFETFKARYEQGLKSQFAGRTFDLAGQPFGAAEYVARRMDTAWTDLFWKLRDPKSHLYDEALMNVFRAVALITRRPDDENYVDDVARLRNGWNAPSHTDFHAHGWLDESFTLAIIHLLDSWSAKTGTLSGLLPDIRYFDEKAFFDEVALNGANLSYTEIAQFAAYVGFIANYHDSIDAAAFQEWMRIIYNLSVNTIYNRAKDIHERFIIQVAFGVPEFPEQVGPGRVHAAGDVFCCAKRLPGKVKGPSRKLTLESLLVTGLEGFKCC
ncbi:unnamed protein product, partial [marine sediment metagenome]